MSTLLAQVDLGQKLLLKPGGAGVASKYATIASFLNVLVPMLFIVAGFILLFLLIGGGFAIIASGGNAKNVESGKTAITGAILGFIVMFAAFWMIQIVEIFFGFKILSP